MNRIPEKLLNYSAYLEGTEFLGIVDVELPSLEAMTETISGAGIAGEFDSPVLGHYGSMTVTLNWRTIANSQLRLAKQKSHAIDFRGVQQIYDAARGEYIKQPVKVSVRGMPKNTSLGNFAVGSTTGGSNELEVSYLKIEIDGKRIVEIDKFNFIAFVDGEDVLEDVRRHLGM